ncbi:hypothetical protein PoB_001503400 [Plakobranchus ocellatus]|uniref:Uncharacterized protein n=1 Tax=Plakobranchus ocellatus TaxID=259542 RepID=A0AAV3YZQ1_9GAST|nr:hypothetical protein PoB_001503400 [Plakobranchus ocellatus]
MDRPLTSGNRPEDVRERPKDFSKDSSAVADKTLENQSQVQNHSAKEIQAENRDDVLRHPNTDIRQNINFPPANSGKQWEDLGQQNSPQD